jgi:hypothetical protein
VAAKNPGFDLFVFLASGTCLSSDNSLDALSSVQGSPSSALSMCNTEKQLVATEERLRCCWLTGLTSCSRLPPVYHLVASTSICADFLLEHYPG